jgi:hypothetical protein
MTKKSNFAQKTISDTHKYAQQLQEIFKKSFHHIIIQPSQNLHQQEIIQGYYKKLAHLIQSAQQKVGEVVVFDVINTSANFRELLAFEKELKNMFGITVDDSGQKIDGRYHPAGDIHTFTLVVPLAKLNQFTFSNGIQ